MAIISFTNCFDILIVLLIFVFIKFYDSAIFFLGVLLNRLVGSIWNSRHNDPNFRVVTIGIRASCYFWPDPCVVCLPVV